MTRLRVPASLHWRVPRAPQPFCVRSSGAIGGRQLKRDPDERFPDDGEFGRKTSAASLASTFSEERKAAVSLVYIAHSAVNAVACARVAAPGIRTTAGLPQIIADLRPSAAAA